MSCSLWQHLHYLVDIVGRHNNFRSILCCHPQAFLLFCQRLKHHLLAI
jgi:hypothetical protein